MDRPEHHTRSKTPARNEPCPCGSGLKYKKCCLARAAKPEHPTDETRTNALKKMSEEKWDEAVDLFKSIEAEVPDRHFILEAIAACHDGRSDYLRAAEYYEKALAVSPESRRPELTYRLGISRACGGRIEKAARAFRQCLEMHSDQEVRSRVEALLHTVEKIQEGNEKPHVFILNVELQRAFTDMENDRFESAAVRLDDLLALDPDNTAVLYNLGVVHTFLKQEEKALDYFRKTVDLDPSYAAAWYNMGQICLIRKRDYTRALNCFERAVAARPDYVGARHQMGVAWQMLGDKERARSCWQRILATEPDHEQAKRSLEGLDSASGDSPNKTINN